MGFKMLRIFALLLYAVLAVPTVYADAEICESHRCTAVVDAGSTGSRLHIYAYDIDETNTPVNIQDVWSKKVKPGFATIDPQQVDAYIAALLADAPVQSLPLYFYSTAGMRLLPQAKQKLYYQQLQQWFSQQPNWQLKEAKTITGKEEGTFDWLAVNYGLGTFSAASKTAPVGVMDFGGASVQIVFPVDDESSLQSADKVELDINGRHLSLFVHSFLGLGQTEVSHQFLESSSCFSNDYPLPDGSTAQGDAVGCKNEISSLMNDVHGVNRLVQPVMQANPVDRWYVMGGIVNLVQEKMFHFDKDNLSNKGLLEQADQSVCHQPWDVLSQQFPDNDYLYGYCMFSAYYYALMVDGYGIIPEKNISYSTDDKNSDWTLGVVIYNKA